MIHENKDDFLNVLKQTSAQTGFTLSLIEKDYYLTLVLSRLQDLSSNLIFKGGTCLNKVYYSYYRLSEDLDFSMRLPDGKVTKTVRSRSMKPIKEKIGEFAAQFGMKLDTTKNPGRNESKQYVFDLAYPSVVLPQEAKIRFEVGLRFNPVCPVEKHEVQHQFTHPFTGERLFDGGEVNCLGLKELVSEKLRAAALRKTIAPRDFYDLDFILRKKFDLTDREVLELFRKKLAEDGGDADITRYRVNLGRRPEEIKDMSGRIKEELFEVLTAEERKNFDLDTAIARLNQAFSKLA
ncbi:MAG: nucleotidyl transferase AbiEii/AbiGii toxin family protein [Candidatus Omnitrophota bacterium]